ncbi:conserved hypothetical protein [Ricinus communis]|uniref:Uncharacterized protein n=1 Tax=Ricinus communis TaxID=3988 RepID=B9SNI1_RICCO|nr:conserved hypothetical protein [Ricinus communis]
MRFSPSVRVHMIRQQKGTEKRKELQRELRSSSSLFVPPVLVSSVEFSNLAALYICFELIAIAAYH